MSCFADKDNQELCRPLVETTRGQVVESVHCGVYAVVDSRGNLLYSCGDVDSPVFMRSSSKPVQALPLIENGGVEAFGLTEQEISVICASHIGTDKHVNTVRGILEKISASEEDMLCGTHTPLDSDTALAMALRSEKPAPARHQCSGKHSGMLAYCRLKGLTFQDYINPEHLLQKKILETLSQMCDISQKEVRLGMDGCSAPVFAVPLRRAAYAVARLCDPLGLSEKRAAACRVITKSMAAHPDMVYGDGGFDSELMRAADGKLISKTGAEGYQIIGVMPGVLGPESPGIGITLKVRDGDAAFRARPLICLEIIKQLGVVFPAFPDLLKKFHQRPVYNNRGFAVGEIRPLFKLY